MAPENSTLNVAPLIVLSCFNEAGAGWPRKTPLFVPDGKISKLLQ